METGSEYYTAWSIYLLAVLVAEILLWRLLRIIKPGSVKLTLHLSLLALLLTPATLDITQSYWVPAFMVALMNGLNEGLEAALPPLQLILIVMLLLISVPYLFRISKALIARKRRKRV